MVEKFKIGDVVRVKTIDEMLVDGGVYNQFFKGIHFIGTGSIFKDCMHCFCDKMVKIEEVKNDYYSVSLVNETIIADNEREIETFFFIDEFLTETTNTNNNTKNEPTTEVTKTVIFINEYEEIKRAEMTEAQIDVLYNLKETGFLNDSLVFKVLDDIETIG